MSVNMDQLISVGEVGRLISLMPVGLKEAAIDSPTARASVQHYYEQVELVEKWLDEYLKSTNRLITESTTLENILNNFTAHATLPHAISETMMDHDYSVLAIKRYHEGAKDFWMSMVSVVKRLNPMVVEPIRQFQTNEIKPFKEIRRTVEQTQKNYDTLQGKYASLQKNTEPSSLREDAFQLHEARRQYLKAMLDFFTAAPQLRFSLDKLIVRIFHDQWKEMRQSRDTTANTFQRSAHEMDRVRGWTREMEDSERLFRRELNTARKQLEDTAELAVRPSRDLEGYSNYTVDQRHAAAGSGLGVSPERSQRSTGEKQGWLCLRTYVRKPTRVVWVKRWAFLRNGIFGWLVQGAKPGTVEESERIGVLLCNIRPLPAEERRFCFELKTNKNTIGLQAETQAELASWLAAIETAKAKAVNDPASSEALTPGFSQVDPAFAITAPPIPEFGTSVLPSTDPMTAADDSTAAEKSSSLGNLADSSREGSESQRRATLMPGEGESQKDHASRIMSKLDLHRKPVAAPSVSSPGLPTSGGGIASLIAASHGSMPVGPSLPMISNDRLPLTKKSNFTLALRDMPQSSLAPSTLTNIPAPTSLSKPAVIIAGERGIYGSRTNRNGIPNGVLANTWGSSNGSYVHRLERNELRSIAEGREQSSPLLPAVDLDPLRRSIATMDLATPAQTRRSRTPSPTKRRSQTVSVDHDIGRPRAQTLPEFPAIYPLQLKTQDAQFRLLFPNVHRDERLVLVFRSTWNPNDQQEFPGRVYITTRDMYFYSNHFGLILTSAVSLLNVDEVTAAPGKDCDFLFMHLKKPSPSGATRVTIKVFLEPLKLLQNRLNFLVKNSSAEEPLGLEDVIRTLLKLENDSDRRSPSMDSWDDSSVYSPNEKVRTRSRANTVDLKAPIRVDRTLYSSIGGAGGSLKFKLPAQPVRYSPPGFSQPAVECEYDVSPKALFHVMFGDKSLLWQLLQHERQARDLKQGPWTALGEGRLYRDFQFSIPTMNMFGQSAMTKVRDYQFVDVNNDHLCYVVTDKKTPWHLPSRDKYRLISKIVITHVAKSKCKMAVYTKVEWLVEPWYLKNAISKYALHDLELDAQDLVDLVTDQVRKLGAYSRTKKAIDIFGQVGQSTEVTQLELNTSALNLERKRVPIQRTMTTLLIRDLTSISQSALGTILEAIIDLATWLGKLCNANSMILLVLGFSALYNTWFITRSSMDWWHERQNIKYLKQMGIGPNNVMSKAVYLHDIHDIMSQNAILPDLNSSMCYQVFNGEFSLHDPDAPFQLASSSPTNQDALSKHRVHDTKQRLGLYRHDLLVAMRVVNSIEQEVVRSEWESWLASEHRRCRAVEPMIHAATKDNSTNMDAQAVADVREWYDTYCVSCGIEYKKVTVTTG